MKINIIQSFRKIAVLSSFVAILGTSAISATEVLAVEPPKTSPVTTSKASNQNNQSKIDYLKTRAQNEINSRIKSMNADIAKIQSNKKLSAAQQNLYVSDLQSQILALTNLQTKINADTDFDTLKADVQSIITSFRIYALYMPKIAILSASDMQTGTADKLLALSKKLQTKIQKFKDQGKDVSSLNNLNNDAVVKINDAYQQDKLADNLVNSLTPAGYPGNLDILKQARGDIKTASSDLKIASTDLKNIIAVLKELYKPTPKTTTPSSKTSTQKTPNI